MNIRSFRAIFQAALLLLLASPALATERQLILQGSNTVGASLAPALVEAWLGALGYDTISREQIAHEEETLRGEKDNGDVIQVAIHAHGSSTAFSGLAGDEVDLGMASRPIKPKELKQLAAKGDLSAHNSEYVIALDGIAVIVHPDNPVASADTTTLRRIFSGELTSWRALGGKEQPIHLYSRDAASGTFDTFRTLVLGKGIKLSAKARRYDSNALLARAIADDPLGIGFVSLAEVGENRALAINDAEGVSLKPRSFTVATEDYALARRLFFYVPPEGNPLAHELARFATSPAGQAVVSAEGMVGQELIAEQPELPEGVPSDYRQLVEGAERLSVNFRFNEGKVALDNKARSDMTRLLEHLGKRGLSTHELILVGFSDKHEALPIYALELSVSRADQVADLLNSGGVRRVRVRGYGSELPVASNDSQVGRDKNRRVEVWVR